MTQGKFHCKRRLSLRCHHGGPTKYNAKRAVRPNTSCSVGTPRTRALACQHTGYPIPMRRKRRHSQPINERESPHSKKIRYIPYAALAAGCQGEPSLPKQHGPRCNLSPPLVPPPPLPLPPRSLYQLPTPLPHPDSRLRSCCSSTSGVL